MLCGLFAVDVVAVLLHDPVQLFLGNAGDLVLHIFTFHGGKAPFCWENLGLVTRFSVRVRLWAGYAPPAAMAAPDICVGNMAPFAGIEPAASGFGDRRSSNMS